MENFKYTPSFSKTYKQEPTLIISPQSHNTTNLQTYVEKNIVFLNRLVFA